MDKKIVIIGGGPCGLGAATRLQQLGHKNWTLIERSDYTGGLATTFEDKQGFSWDIGAHVIFSHYQYFNDLTDAGVLRSAQTDEKIAPEDKNDLKKLWCTQKRETWIRFSPDTFTEYPFQSHFYSLNDTQMTKECLEGILEANNQAVLYKNRPPQHFQDWIDRVFGKGLAKHFMNPYNFKVWGYYPHEMNAEWVGERVATVDLSRTLDGLVDSTDPQRKLNNNASWGPNSSFKYPVLGGTGAIWQGVGSRLDATKIKLKSQVEEIDAENKTIKLSNSETIQYDYLISTLPIDLLLTKYVKPTKALDVEKLMSVGAPVHSSTNVVGIGFNGETPKDLADKSWMYFPSDRSPFYRSTVLSNYSPFMVKEKGKQWSLMFEHCESAHRKALGDDFEEVIQGALNEKLITEEDVDNIDSKWKLRMEYGYPTPYLKRGNFLNAVEPILRKDLNIYSRGRFGGWKYEVSNQDHSVMQGVEAADNILFGCEEQTYFYPDHVNTRKETTRKFFE